MSGPGNPTIIPSILAAEKLKADLEVNSLAELVGKEYFATYLVDWTTSHDVEGEIISHFSNSHHFIIVFKIFCNDL